MFKPSVDRLERKQEKTTMISLPTKNYRLNSVAGGWTAEILYTYETGAQGWKHLCSKGKDVYVDWIGDKTPTVFKDQNEAIMIASALADTNNTTTGAFYNSEIGLRIY